MFVRGGGNSKVVEFLSFNSKGLLHSVVPTALGSRNIFISKTFYNNWLKADPKKLATSSVTSTAVPISFLGRLSHAFASFLEAFVVFSFASSTVVGSLIFLSVSSGRVLVRWLRCSCKLAGLQAVFRFLSFSFERWHYTLLFQALWPTKGSRFGNRLRRTSACTPTGRKCCFSSGTAF